MLGIYRLANSLVPFLEKINLLVGKLKVFKARGQACFKEGRSSLDQILTLHTLIEKEICVAHSLHSCFHVFKKAFNTIPHDKLWECLQCLGVPFHLQRALKAMYNPIYAKV